MIELGFGYVIDADERQYIVGKPRQTVTNGRTRTIIGEARYFTSLRNAVKNTLDRICRDGVEDGEITSLDEWLDEYDRVSNDAVERIERAIGQAEG